MIVSGEELRDSAIHIHVSILPQGSRYLVSIYSVPGPVLGAPDIAVNKTGYCTASVQLPI